jgi:hypothetical protein
MKVTSPVSTGTTTKKKAKSKKPRPKIEYEHGKFPFRILGLSDDNMAYFIGRHNRFIDSPISQINKTLLLRLATIQWWRDNFAYEGKLSWDYPIDFVLEILSQIDFDLSIVCGRGAWRGKNGDICYHDGYKTLGTAPDGKLFLRKSRKDIGLECKPIDLDITQDIAATVGDMAFETPSDAIKIMGWALLAPFAGALPWRPAGLITGPSGSGKSTVVDTVVRPLALPLAISGGYSTEAGVRQQVKNDATAIVVEEAETDTKKKKDLRDDLFSLMRQSTSDNAPKVAKGTKDGRGSSFDMRSMFLFVAISPEVEAVADDNRIFRVNMVRTNGAGWSELSHRLNKLITPDNCKRIRALTWLKLPKIIEFSQRIAPIIQDITNTDTRYGLADGMLIAAYWTVLKGMEDMTKEQIRAGVKVFYDMSPAERQRSETDELVDRILDEKILVEKPERLTLTLREILIGCYKEKLEGTGPGSGSMYDGGELTPKDAIYLRKTAARYGLGVTGDGALVIASNHHEIMKITGKGRGYQRQLVRHKKCIDRNRPVFLAEKTRRCVVIGGVLGVSDE